MRTVLSVPSFLILAAFCGTAAAETEDTTTVAPIEVVGTTPLDAGGARIDRLPAAASVLRVEDLARAGPASTLRALDERLGGVSLDQAQANPFQPSLIYRGFEASPLAGNAQGLAVYLGGVRFNQAFGDTVNWDLVPDVAVQRVELVGSNPAFGLNALGGALSVRLKDGFSTPGLRGELAGGSFGRQQGSAEVAGQSGAFGVYGAVSMLHDDGWRDYSPSRLRHGYADFAWKDGPAEVHLSLLGADNDLIGNGPAPVELLAFRRASVFTYPDETHNRFGRAALTGAYAPGGDWSAQGSAYLAGFRQRSANGDAAEVAPCDGRTTLLCLEGEDEPLTDETGAFVPNFVTGSPYAATVSRFRRGGPYALLNHGATHTESYGAAVQASQSADLRGRPNRLVVGASFDGARTRFAAGSTLGALGVDRGFVGPGIELDLAGGEIGPVAVHATRGDWGVFLSDSLDLTEAVTLTVSGRFNAAEVRLRDRIGTALNGHHTYRRFNPAAGLTWQIAPEVSVYAGYAAASRAPTPAEFSCADPEAPCSLTNFFVSDPDLKQVTAETVEAGVRGSQAVAGAQLAWRAGVYRSDAHQDIQLVASDTNGRGYFVNVGRTRRQGVEAGLTLTGERFSLFADYAFTRATYRTGFTLAAGSNPAFDNGADPMVVSKGDRRPGVPAHNFKLGLDVTPIPALTFGIDGQWTSGRYFQGDEANLNPKTSSYAVANLHAEYRVTERLEVFGQVTNATGSRYATFGTYAPLDAAPVLEAPSLTDPSSVSPGAPRAGYVGLRFRF